MREPSRLGALVATGIAVITLLGVSARDGTAQEPVPAPGASASPTPSWMRPRVTGEATIFGEAYGIAGREARRPGETARAVLQPTFELSRFLRVGVDLQWTTEGNVAQGAGGSPILAAGRQRMNQLGISPTWGWGRVDLGDFTDSYTPYTFSGVRVRGAGTVLTPGWLRFAFIRGQAQTAVLGTANNASYSRLLAGGRLGVGKGDGSHLDLTVIRARDEAGSLPPPGDTAFRDPRLDDPTVDPDTLAVGTILNPLAVTPQDNLVAGLSGRLLLFDGRLRLQGEATGAAYSRDVRATALDNEAALEEIPALLRGLFTPRVGSSFGAAYATSADVRIGRFAGTATFRQVDPGFVSLGVASLLNDQRGWSLGGTQRLGRAGSLRLDVARQRDNLIGQKPVTTGRDRYGAALSLRPLPRLSSSLRVQFVGMHNGIELSDPRAIDYANWIVSTSQTVLLGRDRTLRSVGATYTRRESGDENPLRTASALSAHQVNLRAVLALGDRVSVTPSVGWLRSTAERTGRRTRETYGIAATARSLEGRWSSSLSLGSTDDGGTGAFTTRLTSRYDLTPVDAVTLTVRDSRYRNAPNPFGPPGGFREHLISLQLTHRLGADARE